MSDYASSRSSESPTNTESGHHAGESLNSGTPTHQHSSVSTQIAFSVEVPDRLDRIPECLTDQSNYEIWDFYVKNALRPYNLHFLIDSTIPRPLPTSSSYTKWDKASCMVRTWLVLQLSRDVVQQLMRTTHPIIYVDETYDAIRRIVMCDDHTPLGIMYTKVFDMKRSSYATIAEHVADFRKSVKLANCLKLTIMPFCAIIILLHELEAELPIWAAQVDASFTSNDAQLVTEADFLALCDTAIEKGNDIDQRNAIAEAMAVCRNPPQNASQKMSKVSKWKQFSKRKANDSDWKITTWPEPGISDEDHVAQMRRLGDRKYGNCGYCRYGKHHASSCWYLNPCLRHDTWKRPDAELWVYET